MAYVRGKKVKPKDYKKERTKEKEEKRRKSISGIRDVKRTAGKSERLELATARAERAGIEVPTLEGEKIVSEEKPFEGKKLGEPLIEERRADMNGEAGLEFQPTERRLTAEEVEIQDIENQIAETGEGVLDKINKERLKIKLENIKQFQEKPILTGYLPIGINPATVTSAGGSAFKGIKAALEVQKVTKVAKAEQVGGILGTATTTARYATNAKSITLTKNFALGLGLSLFAANTLIDALGTYPFAGFIKEEASQTTGFGFFTAEKNDDIQGMEDAIKRQEEILAGAPGILSKLPYANVLTQVKEFFKSVAIKLETDKRILEKKKQELKGG